MTIPASKQAVSTPIHPNAILSLAAAYCSRSRQRSICRKEKEQSTHPISQDSMPERYSRDGADEKETRRAVFPVLVLLQVVRKDDDVDTACALVCVVSQSEQEERGESNGPMQEKSISPM